MPFLTWKNEKESWGTQREKKNQEQRTIDDENNKALTTKVRETREQTAVGSVRNDEGRDRDIGEGSAVLELA